MHNVCSTCARIVWPDATAPSRSTGDGGEKEKYEYSYNDKETDSQSNRNSRNSKSISVIAPSSKRFDCCGRLVCASCITTNPRFAAYCTFCQTPMPTTSSRAPDEQQQQLPDAPPAYTEEAPLASSPPPSLDATSSSSPSSSSPSSPPPPTPQPPHAALAQFATSDGYNAHEIHLPPPPPPPYFDSRPLNGDAADLDAKEAPPPDDVIHHLSPDDSISSLHLAYGVPADILRRHNGLWSDHLLAARRMILIPGALYQGPSLAPDPVDDVDEAERKAKIRRLMTRCKMHEYDIAVLYLEQADWSFEAAAQRFAADERWERENPLLQGQGKGKGKGVKKGNGLGRGANATGIGRSLQTWTSRR